MAFRLLDGELFAKMFKGGAALLHLKKDTVNKLNVFPVPDGDTGDNMSMTMEGGVSAVDIKEGEEGNLSEISEKLARGMLLGARGNSGVILSQLFAGMAKVFDGCDDADVNTVGEALKLGVKQAYAAVVTPTEGTILTVARDAVDYACSRISEESTIESLFEDLTFEMNNSLQRTPELLSVLKEAGVIDSGGAGLVYIMEGFTKVLSGVKPEDIDNTSGESKSTKTISDFSAFTSESELEFGYCTELLLRIQKSKVDTDNFDENVIREFLMTVGNSIVCFKQDTIVKLHVHTFTPEKVLEFCRKYGEFLTVKIENMSVQHNENIEEEKKEEAKPKRPRTKHATVAVASGEGIEKLFLELGADYVIKGGQTMNPSAEDFIRSFDEVNADVVFVLPNNGNVILSAKQAAKIYDKSKILVVESRSLGEGYAALSALNYEYDDPEQIREYLLESMDTVTTCMLTTAVRDTKLNDIEIHTGDFISFIGKRMLASYPDCLKTCRVSLKEMILEEKFALTVFAGKDAPERERKQLEKYIRDKYPDIEPYFVDGGQEVYRYIFIAE